ncbi:alpha/beta fold hydrolase [Pseudonocardia acaciae]|uniref:alpha/beta fold hydrolase n=1 Tax=Pseudonocardia acaciae TaxID=551276 RepID=UPI00048A4BC7|nr:alpha/beta hydrolase [Pseudonocardia acaciae]
MSGINHRDVTVNGLRMRIAEAGEGPLVLLLHGFPESWYSWRHQLRALAEAGFHAVAPNQRGYPGTDAPADVEDYTILHLVGDAIGLVTELGERTTTVVGHDWGAPVAWHAALLRPDVVRGVAGLSVPHIPRSPVRPLTALRERFGERFYQLYFQRPGVEAEFEADLDRTFRTLLYGISGDGRGGRDMLVDVDKGFLGAWTPPPELPAWLAEADIAAYTEEFAGASFTGPLNWYRNIDRNWALTAAWDGATISPPALMLAGDRDPVISWFDRDRLEQGIRRGVPDLRRFELLPGAGHWIQQERPDEVNAALVDFAKQAVSG